MGTYIPALSTKIKSFLKLKGESLVVVENFKGEGGHVYWGCTYKNLKGDVCTYLYNEIK